MRASPSAIWAGRSFPAWDTAPITSITLYRYWLLSDRNFSIRLLFFLTSGLKLCIWKCLCGPLWMCSPFVWIARFKFQRDTQCLSWLYRFFQFTSVLIFGSIYYIKPRTRLNAKQRHKSTWAIQNMALYQRAEVFSRYICRLQLVCQCKPFFRQSVGSDCARERLWKTAFEGIKTRLCHLR